MKRLAVFQHVPYELLGTLDPLLRTSGFRIRYINFGRTPDAIPKVDRYDGLIILGGPMNVDQTERHPTAVRSKGRTHVQAQCAGPHSR